MSKQDRTYTRTAAELEQKHGFGKRFSEMLGLIDDTRDKVDSVESSIATIIKTADNDRAAIKLLVEYDSEGVPTASGSFIIEAINGESSAKIEADRLDIEGKQLNIKVDAANITGTFAVKEADGDVLLSAGDGVVKIGSWNVDNNSLWTGTSFSDKDSVFLSTGSNADLSIAGSPAQSNWVIKAGQNFGVNKEGEVYCSKAYIQRGCVLGNNITTDEGMQIGPIRNDSNVITKSALYLFDDSTRKGFSLSTERVAEYDSFMSQYGNVVVTADGVEIMAIDNGEGVQFSVDVTSTGVEITNADIYFEVTDSGIYYGSLFGEKHVLFEA